MTTATLKEAAINTDTIGIICQRRAVRKYKDKPVSIELIEKILDAGRMAPSAINKQPWKFFILTRRETIRHFSKEIKKVAVKDFVKAGPAQILKTVTHLLHFLPGAIELFKSSDHVFYGAPVVIFITAPADNEWASLDVGMCAQNMMLAAKAMGLDSCPVGFGKYVEHTKIYSLLTIPKSDEVKLALIFGYGNETPEMHKRVRNNAFFIDGKTPAEKQ
ncbi:nitroreductase [Ferruginibacter paludis]|uniref:nitroreductase n=1 Tax=Ferruginibacter paludis TaxID=1310417 RepID=UPI0025B459CA|nr:nitroreductase [Ferruginibacter paludis]MDN3654243.1 nitroreductase [Ferruginibacter paludis]